MATIGMTSVEDQQYMEVRRGFSLSRDWGGVAAGAIAGLATALLLATLGGALGFTAGAAALDEAVSPSQGAAAFGVGAALWAGITAIASGIVGGVVFASCARGTTVMRAGIGSMVTWSLGVVLAMMLASTSTVGAMSMTGTAAGQWLGSDGRAPAGMTAGDDRDGAQIVNGASNAERMQVAEAAAEAAATAAWVLFACQVLGLIATVVATKTALRRTWEGEASSRAVLTPA